MMAKGLIHRKEKLDIDLKTLQQKLAMAKDMAKQHAACIVYLENSLNKGSVKMCISFKQPVSVHGKAALLQAQNFQALCPSLVEVILLCLSACQSCMMPE
jgi:hypothetical protein